MYSYAQNPHQFVRMLYNVLVINEFGIQKKSGSSYMLGGFEHANLTTTRVCKSNYQKEREKFGNNLS
jgi:hypothetical protein